MAIKVKHVIATYVGTLYSYIGSESESETLANCRCEYEVCSGKRTVTCRLILSHAATVVLSESLDIELEKCSR